MKIRTVLMRFTEPSRSMQENDRPHINRVSLPREPWHADQPTVSRPRPSEPSIYELHRFFGASGRVMPDWRE